MPYFLCFLHLLLATVRVVVGLTCCSDNTIALTSSLIKYLPLTSLKIGFWTLWINLTYEHGTRSAGPALTLLLPFLGLPAPRLCCHRPRRTKENLGKPWKTSAIREPNIQPFFSAVPMCKQPDLSRRDSSQRYQDLRARTQLGGMAPLREDFLGGQRCKPCHSVGISPECLF